MGVGSQAASSFARPQAVWHPCVGVVRAVLRSSSLENVWFNPRDAVCGYTVLACLHLETVRFKSN